MATRTDHHEVGVPLGGRVEQSDGRRLGRGHEPRRTRHGLGQSGGGLRPQRLGDAIDEPALGRREPPLHLDRREIEVDLVDARIDESADEPDRVERPG